METWKQGINKKVFKNIVKNKCFSYALYFIQLQNQSYILEQILMDQAGNIMNKIQIQLVMLYTAYNPITYFINKYTYIQVYIYILEGNKTRFFTTNSVF